MEYNPTKNKRHSVRLKEYDYSQSGAYFITICTHEKKHMFGVVTDGKILLNLLGLIIEKHIEIMNKTYDDINVNKYIIMPNHIHMIISICRERIVCVPNENPTKTQIPKMIQVFKSSVTKEISTIQSKGTHAMRPLQVWQRSFHDHIIRNEAEYQKIWEYIDTNPLKWSLDKYYTE